MKDILKKYNVDEKKGLTSDKACELLLKYGKNQLKEKNKKTLAVKFLNQFRDLMIIILLIAAIISFIMAIVEGNREEFVEPILIIFIVLVNAIMGVIQENKAEKSLDALKKMSALHTRVIRDGKENIINSEDIVPGDIIKLEAGDFVPADASLLESTNLRCDESILTGESLPSSKDASEEILEDAPIGDRKNMIFSGCSVVLGTAIAVVTETGMNTQIGKIANLLNNEEDIKTPLQKKVTKLSKYLGITAVFICTIIFIIGILNKVSIKSIFMTSIALAVSAIPEGLPATITIILAIGVQRMASKNAIIRKLPAVETLGSASVICSDKTGTLTQNKMTLKKAYTDNQKLEEDINGNNSDSVKELLKYAVLCSEGSVTVDKGEEKHIGDPTETSIIKALLDYGITKDELESKYKRLYSIPFDSERKLMTSVNKMEDKNVVIVKGAFDVIAKRCIKGDLESAYNVNNKMSENALRVIAVAYKYVEKIQEDKLEDELIFMGLVGMIDPPRDEAKKSVETCKRLGIKPVMITGDHIITAKAIAKEIGILEENDLAITGKELDDLEESEFIKKIEHISVYARVSPQNKIRIVKAWQSLGKVVSMTGDGVNDAPALKAADIGCAMGITGTDVAKNASDMILTDDNFATIVYAVSYGRTIYRNIRKVIEYLIGSNIGEILTVFIAMILWKETPLESIQLLWINLVTDGFPALALGLTKETKDISSVANEDIFANKLGFRMVLEGIVISTVTLLAFYMGRKTSVEMGKTFAFVVLSITQIILSFNIKAEGFILNKETFSNKYLNYACLLSALLVVVVLMTPVKVFFGFNSLSMNTLFLLLGFTLIPTVFFEIVKLF